MKTCLLSLLGLMFFSCHTAPKQMVAEKKTSTTTIAKDTNSMVAEVTDTLEAISYADYYLVITNSSKNYKALHNDMLAIHKQFAINIDTLGRYYDTQLNQIILPKDDEDEIYAGSYYPRRYEDLSLSIEYASYYKEPIEINPEHYPTQMVLVAGMFANKKSADSLQMVLKNRYPKTTVQKSKVYIGCMH